MIGEKEYFNDWWLLGKNDALLIPPKQLRQPA
jgi:hypothetical protein